MKSAFAKEGVVECVDIAVLDRDSGGDFLRDAIEELRVRVLLER
jgi:hypothetical protein